MSVIRYDLTAEQRARVPAGPCDSGVVKFHISDEEGWHYVPCPGCINCFLDLDLDDLEADLTAFRYDGDVRMMNALEHQILEKFLAVLAGTASYSDSELQAKLDALSPDFRRGLRTLMLEFNTNEEYRWFRSLLCDIKRTPARLIKELNPF